MSISERMQQDALEAQRITRKFFVVGLDLSRASLDELDELSDNVEDCMRGGANEENIATLARAWGAYLGQVLVREGAGEWTEADNEYGVLLFANGETFSPQMQVKQRITAGPEHSLTVFAESILSNSGG